MVFRAHIDFDVPQVDYDDGEKFERIYAKELKKLAFNKKFKTPEGVRKTKPRQERKRRIK